jgi:hypothetical protein
MSSSLKARLGSVRQLAEKRLLRLERALPILVDFAEDRVYFRGLNIALFTLVLLFIIRAGLFIVFLQFPLLQESSQKLNLDGEPGTSVDFGSPFSEPIKVHVTKTSRRIPVVGRNVSLHIELALPDLLKLPINGFENTITHLSGIALKGSFSIPGFPPKILEIPSVSGSSELTDINGDAIFRNLRINTGVPGAYVITAIDTINGEKSKIGKVQVQTKVTNVIITKDGRQKLGYGRRGLPPRIITGEPLPLLQVKVIDSNKIGIPGKMCVLTSASRESSEFSNVGARPDVFHPRLVVINNPYSTITDEQGFAEFRNVTLSTTIKHIRLWIVCDGRVASYEGSKDRSLIFTGIRKNSQTHTLIATISKQPSTDVLEGEVLSRQPSLLLQYRSITTGQLTPAIGITVFAYPFMQAGFKSRNIMSPAGAAELEMLRESEQAILGNLGRVKQLFNLVSLPSDEKGFANFTNLGFIRHGEAGEYTLGFASTGIFDELESDLIRVKTSVHEVLWVSTIFDDQNYVRVAADVLGSQCEETTGSGFYNCTGIPSYVPDAYSLLSTILNEFSIPVGLSLNFSSISPPKRVASAVCNWPVCRTLWGSSSGFVIYDSSSDISQLKTSNPTFRATPSGTLSSPPTLYISDKKGRKLAGKIAVPITPNNVEITEVPFKGASVSKLDSKEPESLSTSDFFVTFTDNLIAYGLDVLFLSKPPIILDRRGSRLVYHRENLAPDTSMSASSEQFSFKSVSFGDKALFTSEMRETGDQGSFFRVVSAPRGVIQTSLVFEVEGVRTNATSFEVFNIDSDNTTSTFSDGTPEPHVSSLCAHIRILQSPNQFRQDGSVNTDVQESTMSLLFLDQVGNEKPFIVQAVNSFGEPVQVDGIGMYTVDALGYVMVTSVGGEHVGLSSSYTSSLRSLGAATLTIGNYSSMTILREHMLAPIVLQNTNSTGHAVFNLTRIRRAQNTWVKFAFVALYADIKANTYNPAPYINDYWDGPASCVSEFSPPVSIDSVVSSVEWDFSLSSTNQFKAIGSALNSTMFFPLPALPSIRVVASKWAEKLMVSGSSFPFVNVLGETDNTFESVPAHVAVTARTFERDTSSLSLGGPIPQLENNILPSSLYNFVDDYNQVASISASVSSTLGLQLYRWTTLIEDDENSSFVQIASRPSTLIRDNSSSTSAIATLPRISSSRGNVGTYNFIAFSGGVSGSESIQVSYQDDINAIMIFDHLPNLTSLCPPLTFYVSFEVPYRDDTACQKSPPCSGHGHCICGICICADGYDGAEDCSVRYEEDDFGEFFSKSEQKNSYYKGKYGGLPVYDAQKGMRSLEDEDENFNFYESFPRIIFPAFIGLGKFVDSDEYNDPLLQPFVDSNTAKQSKSNQESGIRNIIPVSMRVNDTGNDAWVFSSGLGELLSIESNIELAGGGTYDSIGYEGSRLMKSFTLAKGSSGYRVFPALYSCAGDEVFGWWFSPSWSRCSYDQIPVFAEGRILQGNASFLTGLLFLDHYNLQSTASEVYKNDYRLFLGGVKSGCYRFKWAYAPQGSGDRQYRRLDDTAHQSQIISLGFSRPFRVLGVISSMFINADDYYPANIPRDVVLSLKLVVTLRARTPPEDGLIDLQDFCSDDVPSNSNTARSRFRKYAPLKSSQRCKGESGGLDVTISAINLITRLEYSLYVPSQSFDCKRVKPKIKTNPFDPFTTYQATFDSIQFPSVVNIPPGPVSQFYTEASEIPTGPYGFKFRAYGEEIMTDVKFFVTLVDEPKALVANVPDSKDSNTKKVDLRHFPDYFSNISDVGVSKICNERNYDICSSGDTFCFSSECYIYDYDVSYFLPVASNETCLRECTAYFQAELTKNIANYTRNFAAVVSEISKNGSQLYPTWYAVVPEEISRKPNADSPSVRGSLIEATIVYSPPRSNAILSPTTSSQLTISRKDGNALSPDRKEAVYADFSSLLFESGISGLYILRFSVNTKSPVEPGFLLFDVSNPIQEVKVTLNGAPLSRITSSYASSTSAIRLIESSNLAQTIRVCIVPTFGRSKESLTSNTVTVRLLSDPLTSSSNSQTPFQAPTKKGDGRAWEALLIALSQNKQRFVYAEDNVDEDRSDVSAVFSAYTRSTSNSSRTSIDPRIKGTPLGSDGCVEFSDLSFNTIGYTQRIAVVFYVLGVEGPPLILDLVTLLDANPVSIASLQNQIIIPLVIMMPAFGANSQLIDFKLRFLCLILSYVGLAIIASTTGIEFLTSLSAFYKAFSAEDVQYIYILSISWWVCYAIVIAYLVGVTIAFLHVFYKSFKDRSIMSFRERKAYSSSSSSSLSIFTSTKDSSFVFDMSGTSKKHLSGFFESHMKASIAYTRRLLPRIRIPIEEIIESEGMNGVVDESKSLLSSTTSLSSSSSSSSSSTTTTTTTTTTTRPSTAIFQIKARSVFASTISPPLIKKLENRPTLKIRLYQAYHYLISCIYQLFTSFESSYDAFFYPQRLMIAALVSLICCLLFAALFVYGCSHLSYFAKAALDELLKREAAAIQTAKTKVLLALDETKLTLTSELSSKEISSVNAGFELAFQSTVASVLDQIISESEKSVFGFSIPASLSSRLRGVSNNTLIQSEDPAAEIIRAQRAIAEPWIEASILNLRSSVSFGLSIAAFVVTLVWIDFLLVYKRVILAVRRGNVSELPTYFSWFPERAIVSTAPTFIGIQSIGTMLSFLIFSVIFTLLSFLLSTRIVQEFLRSKVFEFFGYTALISFIIIALRIALLKYVATSGGNISLRSLFSFLDIYFMFFNLVTGAAVAVIRFAILIPFYFILIMRPDIQALPRDPATAAYCSVVLLDSRYNNPIGKVANEIFRKILQEVRQKRLEVRRSSRDLRSIVLNPMSSINSQKSLGGGGISSPNSSSLSSSASKSKRIINRWWLYAMLATHPVLCRYRQRDDEEEDGEKMMNEKEIKIKANVSEKDKDKGINKVVSTIHSTNKSEQNESTIVVNSSFDPDVTTLTLQSSSVTSVDTVESLSNNLSDRTVQVHMIDSTDDINDVAPSVLAMQTVTANYSQPLSIQTETSSTQPQENTTLHNRMSRIKLAGKSQSQSY